MRTQTLLALALLVTVAACVDAPAGEDQTSQALSTFPNDQAAFDYFVGKGLTNFQAAGIVGNLDQESGVDPTIAQYGGGPGRGIAQWSVGGRWDTSTHDNVQWYAGTQGMSATSLQLQLDFIWYELTTYGYGFASLKNTTNVTDATVVFMSDYEICGTCDQTNRVNYAKNVLAAFGAIDYAAKYKSQSWPLASMPPFTVHCGESVTAQIVLTNMGTKSWDSSTRLGTTVPRDRTSVFAGSDWVGPNRAAQIQGTVAPGHDGTFAFAFDGPTGSDCVPGVYDEHFGLVQEGTAWFSDNGQGGPPDDQIEALIQLVPADGSGGGGSGGMGGGDGMGGSGSGSATGSDTGSGGDPGSPAGPAMMGGGCSAGGGGPGGAAGLVLALGAVSGTRRRRGVTSAT